MGWRGQRRRKNKQKWTQAFSCGCYLHTNQAQKPLATLRPLGVKLPRVHKLRQLNHLEGQKCLLSTRLITKTQPFTNMVSLNASHLTERQSGVHIFGGTTSSLAFEVVSLPQATLLDNKPQFCVQHQLGKTTLEATKLPSICHHSQGCLPLVTQLLPLLWTGKPFIHVGTFNITGSSPRTQ